MLEVIVGIDIIGAARHHQAIKIGSRPGTVREDREQPVFASRGKEADISLGHIVINADSAVFQVDYQFWPLIEGLFKCLYDRTFRQGCHVRFD